MYPVSYTHLDVYKRQEYKKRKRVADKTRQYQEAVAGKNASKPRSRCRQKMCIRDRIKIVAPLLVPVPLSLYFDLFDGFIQAYVFVFLTSLFIKESIE